MLTETDGSLEWMEEIQWKVGTDDNESPLTSPFLYFPSYETYLFEVCFVCDRKKAVKCLKV